MTGEKISVCVKWHEASQAFMPFAKADDAEPIQNYSMLCIRDGQAAPTTETDDPTESAKTVDSKTGQPDKAAILEGWIKVIK